MCEGEERNLQVGYYNIIHSRNNNKIKTSNHILELLLWRRLKSRHLCVPCLTCEINHT